MVIIVLSVTIIKAHRCIIILLLNILRG